MQLFRAGILNVWAVLMVGMEQHFVQASPIKYLATFCAHRKVLFFFGRQLFVFVECHPSFRFDSSNAIMRSKLPLESTNLTGTKARSGFGIGNGLTFLREHRLNAGSLKKLSSPTRAV